MGLLSNRIERSSLKPGDHIYSWRTAYIYAHHGIYIGDNKVVHFTRSCGQELGSGTILDRFVSSSDQLSNAGGVVSSCLDCFLAGGNLYRFQYSVSIVLFLAKARGGTCTLASSDSDEVVVERAKFLLTNGYRAYSLFKNNCEDFAVYCKTGLLVVAGGQSGQIVSVVGGPLSVSASVSLMLMTTYACASATFVGFGIYSFGRFMVDRNRMGVHKVEVEKLMMGVRKVEAEDLMSGLNTGSIQWIEAKLSESSKIIVSKCYRLMGAWVMHLIS